MTANDLSITAGIVLSLGFSYVPGLNTWYSALEPTYKRLVMLALLLGTALGTLGLTCLGYPTGSNTLTCDAKGLWTITGLFFEALVANQSTFLLSPKLQGPGVTARNAANERKMVRYIRMQRAIRKSSASKHKPAPPTNLKP